MAKFKIIYERAGCIGASACAAAAPGFWTMDEAKDAKADIIKTKNPTKLTNGNEELLIDEKDLAMNLDAARACPVNVIHIINLDTNEKLI
ncbi:ferredoxin [Candidatus Woesearchaeota archaeon]|nr:ferredoxin [Candidatus Woesearchaeota archaeon]